MKRVAKRVATLIAVVVMVGSFVACGGSNNEDEGGNVQLNGTVTLAGSTSMEKLANALAEGFMAANQGVTVQAEFNGSSAGVEQMLAGTVEIGNASRNLKEGELSEGAVENIVAIDGIAVIVDTNNTVEDITTEDLVKIYTGEVNNWNQLGGVNQPIVVIGREAGSGTRGAFEELLEIEDMCAYAQELDSTGTVMANVAATPGAIGYVSLDVLNDTVSVLAIDGVAASEENIVAGTYSLSRPFVMATKGEVSQQSELVQEFFAYIESEEGQAIIKQVGLILPE
ncbi:MAG: phosphate ABC transporter substrate-binding protein [Agathobacter sp.]|nr:phosphate ABC transporter substrate-binding protein [Agathobacter sp.]